MLQHYQREESGIQNQTQSYLGQWQHLSLSREVFWTEA